MEDLTLDMSWLEDILSEDDTQLLNEEWMIWND